MIYFDQAASSFSKPPEVAEAMMEAVNEYGANPDRGSHAIAGQQRKKLYKQGEKLLTYLALQIPKRYCFF